MTDRLDVGLKRIYEPPAADDGCRVLVERLWPRGVSKDRAALDHWLKDIAPSPELRTWYGHVPDRWPEFRKRYLAELKTPEPAAALKTLKTLAKAGKLTLLFAAKDEERNSALVVRDVLTGK